MLQHPHISKSEFLFYRYAKLVSAAESRTCPHCIAELEKKVIENFGCSSFPPELKVFVKGCISNLHPFVAPDSDLLDILADILQKKDVAALNAIFGTSVIIRGIRTKMCIRDRAYSANRKKDQDYCMNRTMNRSHLLTMLLWVGFASAALAQTNCACVDTNDCANIDAGVFYPTNPLCYCLLYTSELDALLPAILDRAFKGEL